MTTDAPQTPPRKTWQRSASGPNNKCMVCRHAERLRIDVLLAGGATQVAVAKKYGLQSSAVSNHWRKHVDEARKTLLLVGPAGREALAARVGEESESVLDHYRAIRASLYQMLEIALEAKDVAHGPTVANALIKANDAIGKLCGQLASSPLVQNNLQVNLTLSPEFAQFQQDLLRVLVNHPAACRAVMAEFQRLEASVQPAAPALEHLSAETA